MYRLASDHRLQSGVPGGICLCLGVIVVTVFATYIDLLQYVLFYRARSISFHRILAVDAKLQALDEAKMSQRQSHILTSHCRLLGCLVVHTNKSSWGL